MTQLTLEKGFTKCVESVKNAPFTALQSRSEKFDVQTSWTYEIPANNRRLHYATALVEILYRILQDFLGSCTFPQVPTQDLKW